MKWCHWFLPLLSDWSLVVSNKIFNSSLDHDSYDYSNQMLTLLYVYSINRHTNTEFLNVLILSPVCSTRWSGPAHSDSDQRHLPESCVDRTPEPQWGHPELHRVCEREGDPNKPNHTGLFDTHRPAAIHCVQYLCELRELLKSLYW